jgi:hypothetical protein
MYPPVSAHIAPHVWCVVILMMTQVLTRETPEKTRKEITLARNCSVSFRGLHGYPEIPASGLTCQHPVFQPGSRLAGLLQTDALAAQVVFVVTTEIDHTVRLHFDNACCYRGDELPVMADEDKGTGIILQGQVQ